MKNSPVNRKTTPAKPHCALCAGHTGWNIPIGWWITVSIPEIYNRQSETSEKPRWNQLTSAERRTIIKHTEQTFDHQQLTRLLQNALEKALAEINPP